MFTTSRTLLPSSHHVIRQFSSLTAYEQLVGNTKLVRLKAASEKTGCDIYGKCEYENPGGSVKDRAALWMVRGAEERGELKRGQPGVIVEGTAGNTGIGLALAAGVFGYKCIICIAETQSVEKKNMLRWAGAHLVEVPAVPYKNPNNYVHVAKRLAQELSATGTNAFYANQWDNLDNRRAHVEGTGPEILRALDGKVDWFSCAMGTGGTLSGVSEFMRANSPSTKIGLTDPAGAALVHYFNHGELKSNGSSITEGIGQGRITGNIDGFNPDLALEIPDADMMETFLELQEVDGLCLGGSGAVNVAGAIAIAREQGPGKTLVTMLCDSSSRYASKFYNPQFLAGKMLPIPHWLDATDNQENDFLQAVNEAAKRAILPEEQAK